MKKIIIIFLVLLSGCADNQVGKTTTTTEMRLQLSDNVKKDLEIMIYSTAMIASIKPDESINETIVLNLLNAIRERNPPNFTIEIGSPDQFFHELPKMKKIMEADLEEMQQLADEYDRKVGKNTSEFRKKIDELKMANAAFEKFIT